MRREVWEGEDSRPFSPGSIPGRRARAYALSMVAKGRRPTRRKRRKKKANERCSGSEWHPEGGGIEQNLTAGKDRQYVGGRFASGAKRRGSTPTARSDSGRSHQQASAWPAKVRRLNRRNSASCGDCSFRRISPSMKFPPQAVIDGSSSFRADGGKAPAAGKTAPERGGRIISAPTGSW